MYFITFTFKGICKVAVVFFLDHNSIVMPNASVKIWHPNKKPVSSHFHSYKTYKYDECLALVHYSDMLWILSFFCMKFLYIEERLDLF